MLQNCIQATPVNRTVPRCTQLISQSSRNLLRKKPEGLYHCTITLEIGSWTRCQKMGEEWKIGYCHNGNWRTLWTFIASKIRKKLLIYSEYIIVAYYTGWWRAVPLRGYTNPLTKSRCIPYINYTNLCVDPFQAPLESRNESFPLSPDKKQNTYATRRLNLRTLISLWTSHPFNGENEPPLML